MTKRVPTICIAILMTIVAAAQVQQGIVKTRGRMVNGILQPGRGLQGATIQIKNSSTVKSGANGQFSFPLRTNTYTVVSVNKQGYELIDMETCRNYQYSDTPLYLVMDTRQQQTDDKLAAERKLRRTLEKQLHEREDELEALLEQKKLTEDEYRAQLEQLYNQQSSNESLISQMAARYALIDYDQLDEEDRLINECILSGQLQKADSLLNQKGDFKERRDKLLQLQQANREQQEVLNRSKAYAEKEMADLGNFCYNKYQLFKMKFQNDSAAYYIASRADIDTTNVQWQLDAGEFLVYIADFARAKTVYERGVRHALVQYGEASGLTAECYLGLGSLYQQMDNKEASFMNIQKAVTIFQKVGEGQKTNLAWAYTDLALYYFTQNDYDNAIDNYEKAIKMMNPADPGEFIIMAQAMTYCGVMHDYKGNQDKAREYYNAVIKACDSAPDGFVTKERNKAMMYLGVSYYEEGNYHAALVYFKKAEDIIKSYGNNIDMGVRNTLKSLYLNMGNAYKKLEDYDNAMACYLKTLEMETQDFGNRHHRLTISAGYIADIYRYWNMHDEALDYYQLFIEIRKEAFGDKDVLLNERKNSIRQYNKSINDSISATLSENDFEKSIVWIQRAIRLTMMTDGEGNTMAGHYALLGFVYKEMKDYRKALEYVCKAIPLFDDNTPADDVQTIREMETNIRYELAINTDEERKSLDDFVLVITIDDEDTPAARLGLKGEYFILEWAGWNMESDFSLLSFFKDIREKLKEVVLMKDGRINSYHFEGLVGGYIRAKQVGKDLHDRVIADWHNWKNHQKNF